MFVKSMWWDIEVVGQVTIIDALQNSTSLHWLYLLSAQPQDHSSCLESQETDMNEPEVEINVMFTLCRENSETVGKIPVKMQWSLWLLKVYQKIPWIYPHEAEKDLSVKFIGYIVIVNLTHF